MLRIVLVRVRPQELERYFSIQLGVVGCVHLAHSPAADPIEKNVPPKLGAARECDGLWSNPTERRAVDRDRSRFELAEAVALPLRGFLGCTRRGCFRSPSGTVSRHFIRVGDPGSESDSSGHSRPKRPAWQRGERGFRPYSTRFDDAREIESLAMFECAEVAPSAPFYDRSRGL